MFFVEAIGTNYCAYHNKPEPNAREDKQVKSEIEQSPKYVKK